jgi:hypothetical protein
MLTQRWIYPFLISYEHVLNTILYEFHIPMNLSVALASLLFVTLKLPSYSFQKVSLVLLPSVQKPEYVMRGDASVGKMLAMRYPKYQVYEKNFYAPYLEK